MDLVRKVTLDRMKSQGRIKDFPEFKTGDTLNVHVKVKEGEKERIQVFKGIVIKIQGSGISRAFTVRKVSSGVGVERTFPFASPAVDKVEVISYGFVRRSRLFYLRNRFGKAANVKSELAAMRQKRVKAQESKKASKKD